MTPGEAVKRPRVAAAPCIQNGFQVLLGLRGAQKRLPSVVPPIIFSLLLARPVLSSVVSTRQLETNEVLLNTAQRPESAAPSDASSVAGVDEAPIGDPVSSAAEARRPNVSSRDEGNRRHRPADIRCYCNLPRCVSTGYMCKSASGACFSDLADRSELAVELATHGCIELLPSARRGECRTAGNESKSRPTSISLNSAPCPNKKAPKSDNDEPLPVGSDSDQRSQVVLLLLCCHSDMCNHIDSPEIHQRLTNGSLLAGAASAVNTQSGGEDTRESASNQTLYFGNGQDGWFRVATIAVPICGAFILMLLIFVAFKILRTDSEEQKLRGQRLKQCCHSSARTWDEEDLCLHHQHCQAQGHLLSSESPYSEENCQHSGCGKGPSGTYSQVTEPKPVNSKVHLLPQRPQVENPNVQKKSTKLDFLFVFPRSGKSEKRESGKLQQNPPSGGNTKGAAVVMVSVQGRRDQI